MIVCNTTTVVLVTTLDTPVFCTSVSPQMKTEAIRSSRFPSPLLNPCKETMYYKHLETSARAKASHNSNNMRAAAERLKSLAKRKKARKAKHDGE